MVRKGLLLGSSIGLCVLFAGPSVSRTSAASRASLPPQALVIQSGTLTVGSDTTYPPMESKDPNSLKFVGADVDLATALAHAMGLKGATIVPNTFDSLIPTLLTRHKYDIIMSSMSDLPSRRKAGLAFVDYMRASESILVKSSSSIHVNGYAGMCGRTVAVERGTTEQDGLNAANKTCKNKITVKLFAGDTDAYNAFAAGHADAYTSDFPVVVDHARNSGGKYRVAGAPFGALQDYGIGMPATNKAMYKAITKAYHAIRANGQYIKILKHWNVQGAAL